jgi:hypothetical protein
MYLITAHGHRCYVNAMILVLRQGHDVDNDGFNGLWYYYRMLFY